MPLQPVREEDERDLVSSLATECVGSRTTKQCWHQPHEQHHHDNLHERLGDDRQRNDSQFFRECEGQREYDK